MDVFKLAFETTVVGLLTIGWLAVVACLLFPDSLAKLRGFLNRPPASDSQKSPDIQPKIATSLGVGALILAYCLGSAVLPISNQLVNDEHWPLNQDGIRCQVFVKLEGDLRDIGQTALPSGNAPDWKPKHCSYWAPVFHKGHVGLLRRLTSFFEGWVGMPMTDEEHAADEHPCDIPDSTECKQSRLLTLFQQQETAVFAKSDGTERLRQLHERIVVLRGALFSLFVLFLVFLFAYFAVRNGSVWSWVRQGCGIALGVAFAVFAAINGYQDFTHQDIFDIPVLECLLIVITILGVVLAFKKKINDVFRLKRLALITFFFAGLTYGGWMWSEVLYDQLVISSFVLSPHNQPAAQP